MFKKSKVVKTSDLIAGVESCWNDIQKRHKEVPDAIFTLGGSISVYGHFRHSSWSANGSIYPEVFLSGEGLSRGEEEVFSTLLHEAAHSIAHARDIRDTSTKSGYHNRRFIDVADEVGLEAYKIEERKHLGFAFTDIKDSTVDEYAKTISDLSEVLTMFRIEYNEEAAEKVVNLPECGCGRTIRLNKRDVIEGVICASCRQKFTYK